MRPGNEYTVVREIKTIGPNDEELTLRAGVTYRCIGVQELADDTGEVVRVPEHVRLNSSWYLKAGFNPIKPAVSQLEYVTALARGYDGLSAGALFETAELEGFGPLEKPIPRSGFTRCLTEAVANGKLVMQKDGVVVTKKVLDRGDVIKNNCTYHKPAPKARNRDGLFAA
jgi:hypothetical protein